MLLLVLAVALLAYIFWVQSKQGYVPHEDYLGSLINPWKYAEYQQYFLWASAWTERNQVWLYTLKEWCTLALPIVLGLAIWVAKSQAKFWEN